MNKTNQHRIGKYPFQAYITEEEKKIVDAARDRIGVQTNRELLLALSRNFIANPNHYAG